MRSGLRCGRRTRSLFASNSLRVTVYLRAGPSYALRDGDTGSGRPQLRLVCGLHVFDRLVTRLAECVSFRGADTADVFQFLDSVGM